MRTKDTSISVVGIAKGAVEEGVKRLTTQPNDGEKIVASGVGNMPEWAGENGSEFWRAADQFERKTGPACLEVALAMPQGISKAQGQQLLDQFVEEEIGPKAYAFSILADKDGDQPTKAIVMVSPRVQDDIYRDQDHLFRRYRKALPAFSGARKDGAGKVRGKLTDPDLTRLQNWRRICASAVVATQAE
jgi:hypothetical protein